VWNVLNLFYVRARAVCEHMFFGGEILKTRALLWHRLTVHHLVQLHNLSVSSVFNFQIVTTRQRGLGDIHWIRKTNLIYKMGA